MSSTEIATIFLDKDLNIKRFTPPTKSLLNLLPTDIGRPFKDIAPNFADDTMLNECRLVIESQRPIEREIKTFEHKYFLRRVLPYRTGDAQVAGVVITFVDLTQRKQAETVQRESDARHLAELHESKERLHAILNTVTDSIITVDLEGKIDSINQATERLFEFERNELVGKNLSLLLPTLFTPDRANGESQTVAARLLKLVGNRREVLAQRKNGSTFPVDIAMSRVDHLGVYTGILRDITDQKQLQAHILEIATEEQSRIGQELHDGTQQELTGLSLFAGAINDFLDNATHESQTATDDWTLRDVDYQQIKRTLGKLTQGLLEANEHVHQLSHGIMPVQIDAEGLKAKLSELAISTNINRKVNCHFEFVGKGAIRNNAVATQLYRITQESLTNAIKHGNASDIQITLSQSSTETVLEISDNGTGFEPADESSETGLGMRIMKYRASIVGGQLDVSQNNRNGTTVRCTIPSIGDLE
jgi:PAS domain S-box-containing protein